MSVEENAAPKRRSSAANRRRSRRAAAPTTQPQATTTPRDEAPVAEAESTRLRGLRRKAAEPAPEPAAEEVVAAERHVQRREDRRRAKQQRTERTGVARVVNTERMSGVQKFYHDTASEIRKVVWPDRETTRNLTIVVIAMSVFMGVLLGGIDFVLFQLFEAI